MIRFASAAAPAVSPQAPRVTAHITAPLKTNVETSATAHPRAANESKEIVESNLLLAELPEVPTKAAKARSPRKPKAKADATAAEQLDLNT